MKPLTSLGYSDFKSLREGKRYFVDKSLFIRDVIYGAETTLFARPRRFGKTLNMSMLRYFFDVNAGENAHLFEGLAIQSEADIMAKQGKHPVIFLSFKDVKKTSWKDTFAHISSLVRNEVQNFLYLLDGEQLTPKEANRLQLLADGDAPQEEVAASLQFLSLLLTRYHQSKTVILLDEYDTPIHSSWLNGFYSQAIAFFRDFLSGALKDNPSLEKGALTGILRVAKESIFSGLNNFDISTVLTVNEFSDKFGFTVPEVQKMLSDYGMNGREWEEIENWYNGYRFGREVIFNPWSILNYVKAPDNGVQPYWVNTSDNAILKRLFFYGKANIMEDLDALLRGEKIAVEATDNVVFSDLDAKQNAVWTMLLFSGYLKFENPHRPEGSDAYHYDLSIPNREVRYCYREIIQNWLQTDLQTSEHDLMLEYLTRGELAPFENYLRTFVEQVFSYHDTPKGMAENFYHAFLLGLFAKLEGRYAILSNREAGYGRYDLCLIPKIPGKKGIVIEIKAPNEHRGETLETAIVAAEQQMQLNKYEAQLSAHGITQVFRLAIAVQGKAFLVKEV